MIRIHHIRTVKPPRMNTTAARHKAAFIATTEKLKAEVLRNVQHTGRG